MFFLVGWSSEEPHWHEISQWVMGQPLDETNAFILFKLRFPRIILTMLVGSALALAGLALQILFRNPLVDPFVIGVSGGGSLGAGLALLFQLNLGWMGISSVPICALVTALLTMYLVYRLGTVGGYLTIEYLLLAGVALSALSSSLLSLLLVLKGEGMEVVVYWIMGSFAGRSWQEVGLLLPFLLLGLLLLGANIKALNVFQLGEEGAQHLGIAVERAKWEILLGTTLLAAAVVSVSGVIGFVGLIIPHIGRFIARSSEVQKIWWPTAWGGAILMGLADGVAKNLLPHQEIPVGILTALLGVPFFLFLLLRQRWQPGR